MLPIKQCAEARAGAASPPCHVVRHSAPLAAQVALFMDKSPDVSIRIGRLTASGVRITCHLSNDPPGPRPARPPVAGPRSPPRSCCMCRARHHPAAQTGRRRTGPSAHMTAVLQAARRLPPCLLESIHCLPPSVSVELQRQVKHLPVVIMRRVLWSCRHDYCRTVPGLRLPCSFFCVR